MADLLERRATLTSDLRSLNDAHPDSSLPADAQSRWEALTGEMGDLDARIARQAAVDDAERRVAGQPIGSTGDMHLDRARNEVRLADVVRAQLGSTDRRAGLARETSAELERRSGRTAAGMFWSMGASDIERRVLTTGGSGGTVVATDVDANRFIGRLYATTQVRRLGATVLAGNTGNVDIPRLAGSTTAGWVAENAALTISDPNIDKVTLRPKSAGVLTEYSRLMLLQSTADIEALLENDMARTLAVTLDTAAIAGTGTANQPTGILNTSGIGNLATGTNGGAFTFNTCIDIMGLVQDQNADTTGAGFLTNYKVKRAAQKLLANYNLPLTEDFVFQGAPRAFTTAVPSNLTKGSGANLSALIYGNFPDLLIAIWSELDILVNPYESVAYSKGNVQIRAMMTVDIGVRHPESFAAVKDLTP